MTDLEKMARAMEPDVWLNFDTYVQQKQLSSAEAEEVKRTSRAIQRSVNKALAALKAIREPNSSVTFEMARVAVTSEGWWKNDFSHHAALSEEERERIGLADGLHGNPSKWHLPHWRAAIDHIIAQGEVK